MSLAACECVDMRKTDLFIIIVHFERVGNHPCYIPERYRVNMLYRNLPLHAVITNQQAVMVSLGVTRNRVPDTNLCPYTQDVAPETNSFVREVHPTMNHYLDHQGASMSYYDVHKGSVKT